MSKFRILKILIVIFVCVFLLYHSIYFEKLSDRQKETTQTFDPATYVSEFWQNLQILKDHVNIDMLLPLLASDVKKAITQYGKTLGVSSNHSFLVKGRGVIAAINDNSILLFTETGSHISIQTDFIFGNDVRDASGLVSISDFPSTMEFNAISSEINKIITTQVLPPVLSETKVGDTIHVVGACTVNEDNPEINPLQIVPIKLEIFN